MLPDSVTHKNVSRPLTAAMAAIVFFILPCGFADADDRTLPQRSRSGTVEDYSSIIDRGVFGDGTGTLSSGDANGEFAYKLVGTIESGEMAGAVLEDRAGQAFYPLHKKLSDGSKIVRVFPNRATIRRPDGSLFDLMVTGGTQDAAPPAIARPETGAELQREDVQTAQPEKTEPPAPTPDEVRLTPEQQQAAETNIENMSQLLKSLQTPTAP